MTFLQSALKPDIDLVEMQFISMPIMEMMVKIWWFSTKSISGCNANHGELYCKVCE